MVTEELSYVRYDWLFLINQPINSFVISQCCEGLFSDDQKWRLARRTQVLCLEGLNCRVWRTISLMESQLRRLISRFGLVCILEYSLCIFNHKNPYLCNVNQEIRSSLLYQGGCKSKATSEIVFLSLSRFRKVRFRSSSIWTQLKIPVRQWICTSSDGL